MIDEKPRIRSESELDADRAPDLSKNWVDVSLDFEEALYLLSLNGVGFSPIGDIQAITGREKNGKTFVLVQLMAAILGSSATGGLRLNTDALVRIGHEPRVLFVDTEQSLNDTLKVARRVHYLCGWEFKRANERFRLLNLREEEDVHVRFEKIMAAIDEMHPDAVFIDGIRDIMRDFNDLEESSEIIRLLMKTATEKKCCIWCALHENSTAGNGGSSKMRGHLGTELSHKVSDTLRSEKVVKDNDVTFKVEHIMARGKDIFGWKFMVSDEKCKFGIPSMLGEQNVEPNTQVNREEELLSLFRSFGFRENGKSFSELSDDLKAHGYRTTKKQYELIYEALAFKWLEKANRRYYLHSPSYIKPMQTNLKIENNETNIDPFTADFDDDPSLQ